MGKPTKNKIGKPTKNKNEKNEISNFLVLKSQMIYNLVLWLSLKLFIYRL
jgi:hypothetical protein